MWCVSSSIKTSSMADTYSLKFMEIPGFFFDKSYTVLGQNDSFLYLKPESIQFFFYYFFLGMNCRKQFTEIVNFAGKTWATDVL